MKKALIFPVLLVLFPSASVAQSPAGSALEDCRRLSGTVEQDNCARRNEVTRTQARQRCAMQGSPGQKRFDDCMRPYAYRTGAAAPTAASGAKKPAPRAGSKQDMMNVEHTAKSKR